MAISCLLPGISVPDLKGCRGAGAPLAKVYQLPLIEMKSPAANVTVTTEVGFCPFCGRTRNLRREERHLGGLVRTNIDCESCHRTLSSTMAPAAPAVPEVPAAPEAPEAPPVETPAPTPEPAPAPKRARKPAASRPAATKRAPAKKKA